jgi:hypothetical protein
MNRMHKLYEAKIYRALMGQINDAIELIKQWGEDAASRIDRVAFNDELSTVILNLYRSAGTINARFIYGIIQKQIPKEKQFTPVFIYKRFGFNERWTAIVEAYFNKFLLDKAVIPITETTKKFILQILNKGIEEGWGYEEIARELRTSPITRQRARLIVRTESARATNFGGMMAAWESDFECEKFWIEVKDNRTRLTHRHSTGVGGEKVDLLEKYSNGLMFPGDPQGSAKEVCNCRCTQGFKLKRDARGRLIPKQSVNQSGGMSIIEALKPLQIEIFISLLASQLFTQITEDNVIYRNTISE